MPSPLFPNFNRLLRDQQQALQQWAESQAKSFRGRSGTNQPRSSEPMRYGANSGPGGSQNWLWNKVLRKLGPIGQIVDAMLRPQGRQLAPDVQRELDAAQKLLETFGYRVGEPGGTVAAPEEAPTRRRSNTSLERPEFEPQIEPESGEPGGPLVEGMIPVTSSNVHSIGYEWNAQDERRPGTLLVRFLGGTGKQRSGPGPLYKYKDVPREMFTAFKLAASKGKFVWDELRIRGTVSGHQYDYSLEGTGPSGYVPRQAGLKRGRMGEFYLPRNFAGRRSTLPERQVRGPRGPLEGFRGRG